MRLRWIASLLRMPFRWEKGLSLVRPSRIEWNPSLRPLIARINDSSIYYAKKGEGEPTLLIHGYGAGMWVWEKQIDLLSQFCEVYVLDVIGHGFSDRPRISYGAETYLHFLRGFMDAVGIRKATLVGNSMGGAMAWAMAILFPERVKRLILVDCAPPDVLRHVSNESFLTLAILRRLPFLFRMVIAGRDQKTIRKVLEECVFDTGQITREVLKRQYQLSRIKGATRVLYRTLKHAEEALKFQGQLSRITVPTLLIWGEKDMIFPPSVGESLHRAIPGSTWRVIEKSGHIPMWETPEAFNEVVLPFLKTGQFPERKPPCPS